MQQPYPALPPSGPRDEHWVEHWRAVSNQDGGAASFGKQGSRERWCAPRDSSQTSSILAGGTPRRFPAPQDGSAIGSIGGPPDLKCLVTGAAGVIASNLVDRLLSAG